MYKSLRWLRVVSLLTILISMMAISDPVKACGFTVSPNKSDRELAFAVDFFDLDRARIAIKNGARVDYAVTELGIAVRKANPEMVKLLLDNGAPVNAYANCVFIKGKPLNEALYDFRHDSRYLNENLQNNKIDESDLISIKKRLPRRIAVINILLQKNAIVDQDACDQFFNLNAQRIFEKLFDNHLQFNNIKLILSKACHQETETNISNRQQTHVIKRGA